MTDWTLDDLREGAQSPLWSPSQSRPAIDIRELRRGGHTDAAGSLIIDIDIDVHGPAPDTRERWRLTFRTMWSDLQPLPLDAATLITRANIEEWWDTRGQPQPNTENFVAEQLG